ncbi:MAG: peptide MFS transporter, partial [bacterium]|nr:peptide MFS transporter [bacterium]
ALVIALGSLAQANLGDSINLGLYTGNPLVLAIIIGIMLQGLAECFLSPKFLEYASKPAPKGEIGLYLGYQHLTTFLAWFLGFLAAGFLLDRYCPDPRKLDAPTRHQWRLATDPNYRFTLSEPFRGELVDNVPVSPSLAQVLRDAGLGLPGDPRLVKLKTKDDWKSDPERAWAITEGLFTVEERVRDASDERTIHVVPAEHHGADGKGLEREGFVLDGGVGDYFDDGEPLGERGRLALAEHGIAVSEAAIVRAREIGESGSAGDRWRVALERYHIEEAKLEADADAKENGRERALRDVLVYAHTARAPETTPPLPDEYAHAHHIWYAFSGVGFAAFIGLLVFKFVTGSIDRRQAAAESHPGG